MSDDQPTAPVEFGPLRGLAGVWEGDEGVDVGYANARDLLVETNRATISIDGDVWSSDEETLIEHARWTETVCHTDRNRLQRVA
jgi:hypothetical protein